VRGQHTVQIRKRSETVYGTFALGDVKIFRGSLGADSVSRRRIQIIGDSISVGYGLDGTYPCTNSAFLENAPKTYGALTAKSLSAEYDILAWSGIGLIRNTIGSSDPVLMPQLWTRYGTNDADNSYMFPRAETPDIVVINLGTNDFSYLGVRDPVNATMLTDSMIAFAETIRSHYPKAELFLTSSPMLSDTYPTTQDAQHTTHVNVLKAAAEKLGSKAHVVDFPAQGSEVGCDYHPNAAEHEKLAAILTSAIKEVMW
jgi:lysophospholipase L1-like esterase